MKVAGLYPCIANITTSGEREYLEPLGLQYVLAQAERQGHEVELFSLYKLSPNNIIDAIATYRPDVLAVSAMTAQMPMALRLTNEVKRLIPEVKVVFGGYHASVVHKVSPEIVLSSPVDIWVRGEGEETFSELLDRYTSSSDCMSDILGITYAENGKIVSTPPRCRVARLDKFGNAWRPRYLNELRNYGLTYPAPSQQTGFVSIDYSRGCLGNCDFCASPEVLGRKVTFRSITNVVDEIKHLHDDIGVNTFFFTDLDFIQQGYKNQEKVEALLEALVKLSRPIYWECLGRIKSISSTGNYSLLEKMYRAGCRKIGWGIESIDSEILRSMNKDRLEDEMYEVLAASEDASIFNSAFFIIGWHDFNTGIGDSEEAVIRQAKVLPQYPLHRVRVAVGTPLPGSAFYRQCHEQQLITSRNLGDYDTGRLVYAHPSLEPNQMPQLILEVKKSFYESQVYSDRIRRLIARHPEYRATLTEFYHGPELANIQSPQI